MKTGLSLPMGCVKFTRGMRFFAHGAFTKVELLVVIAVMGLIIGLVIPALGRAKAKAHRIACVGCLKNIGLAHRIFATDNKDLFPWQTNSHQFKSLTAGEQVVYFYRTLSNELSTPKILVCRADTRKAVVNWQELSTNNISYFLGLSAEEVYPQSILGGDRNLTVNGERLFGRVQIPGDSNLGWDGTIHKFQGNVVMGDGSVQQISSMRAREQLRNTGLQTNIFLFP
jgi:type II secretory pathway pseudopilin PulG